MDADVDCNSDANAEPATRGSAIALPGLHPGELKKDHNPKLWDIFTPYNICLKIWTSSILLPSVMCAGSDAHSAISDLGIKSLHRPVCPNTLSYYTIHSFFSLVISWTIFTFAYNSDLSHKLSYTSPSILQSPFTRAAQVSWRGTHL